MDAPAFAELDPDVLSIGAGSPATSPSTPKPVHDAPADDWVGELPELPVAPRVELARGDPELRDAEGDEILSTMGVEHDVPASRVPSTTRATKGSTSRPWRANPPFSVLPSPTTRVSAAPDAPKRENPSKRDLL